MKTLARPALRSAATSISTMAGVRIRALTERHPIKPTSPRCHSAWQLNLGRHSTYRRGKSVQTTGTTTEHVLKLKDREADLRAQGVTHAALFGSIARGDDRPDSDIDIMIELDPAARVTMFDYVEIKEYIEGLFSELVDVVNRDGLKPLVRPKATADAIYAF